MGILIRDQFACIIVIVMFVIVREEIMSFWI
jgi:hypothetical protein